MREPYSVEEKRHRRYKIILTIIFILAIFSAINSGYKWIVNQISPEEKFKQYITKSLIPWNLSKDATNVNVLNAYQKENKISIDVEVPFDIKIEEVKPTIIAVLFAAKQQHKGINWFRVFLWPSKELKGSGKLIGIGVLENDCLEIKYAIPDSAQLAELEKLEGHSMKPTKEELDLAAKTIHENESSLSKTAKLARSRVVMYYSPNWGNERLGACN